MNSKKRKEYTFGTLGFRPGTNTGFFSKINPILVRWLLRWEVTDRKDTWSDEFLVAVRAFFRAMEMLEMAQEQSKDNCARRTTWAILAIDFQTATATKIPRPEVRPWSMAWACADTKGKSRDNCGNAKRWWERSKN